MHVLFSKTAEFLEEARIAHDAGVVEGGVVRVTYKIVTDVNSGMTTVFLSAGYFTLGTLYYLEDRLIEDLTARLAEEGVPKSAQALLDRLRGLLTDYGLIVRGGLFVI
jgi:hypothetical protein